jgi:uncharacterized protein (TIGR02996 family)
MDDLDRREAFLLAIFAAPDDDLPRLVYADYLDESGHGDAALRIRAECDRKGDVPPAVRHLRGFRHDARITCPADLLADPAEFRRRAILQNPEWYGCVELKVSGGKIASSKPIGTLLLSPVAQRVTRLDLSGTVVGTRSPSASPNDELSLLAAYQLTAFEYQSVITLQAVEALVGARECRRFTHLDLTNNDLDNDAARAILRSNYLTRLTSLHLFDGNQLRGRTWAALQEKFGEGVLS